MKAAVVHEFGAPLLFEEVPTPTPGEGEVLVKIEASGLCHTDIHAAHGDWPVKPTLPFIPGHEGVGVVVGLGSRVTNLVEGDRVAISWLGRACQMCEYCISGRETLCAQQINTGYTVDGCYAEFAVASAAYVTKVPVGINPLDAAPLSCAGVTAYKAVKSANVRSSDVVAVFGIGGLGHLALQYARIAGATVVAVDVVAEKLELAKRLGAEFTVDASLEDPVAAIRALGGADAALGFAVAPKPFEQAYASLRRGGRLVLVALPAENHISIPIFETVLNETSVSGSIVGTRLDLAETFQLHAEGRTAVVRETRLLHNVNAAFAEVEAGAVPARLVFELDLTRVV